MRKLLFIYIVLFAMTASAAPFRYSVKNKKTGQVTNAWLSTKFPKTYYEPGFGKPERWEPGSKLSAQEKASALDTEERTVNKKKETFYLLPSEFEILEEDLAAEEAAKESKRAEREAIKALKNKSSLTDEERDQVLLYLLKEKID